MTLKGHRYHLNEIPHCPKEGFHQCSLEMNHFGKLQSNLRKTPFRKSQRILKELVCSICKKVHRTLIELEIHMQEFHSDLSAQEIKVYQSDSSLVNIDEFFLSDNEEYCQDNIDYLLKSSGL